MKSQSSVIPVDPRENKILGIVFLTFFLDLMGFGLTIPAQPFLAQSLGASPKLITLLGSVFSVMQFLFAPFWGRLSDRIGRRPVVLISVSLSASGYFLFFLAQSYEWLLFARMLSGLGSANLGTVQAIVGDVTPPERRARGMGILGAAFGLGFIFGPAIGGFLTRYGLGVPALAAGCLCCVNLVWAFFSLPETRDPRLRDVPSATRFIWNQDALSQFAKPQIGLLLLTMTIFTCAFSMMEQVIGLLVGVTWVPEAAWSSAGGHRAAELTAWVLITVGVTATIVQGMAAGRLTAWVGERVLLRVGLVGVGVSIASMPLAALTGQYSVFLVSTLLVAGSSSILNPSLSSLLSRRAGASEQGKVMGQAQSLGALGRALGPSMAGALFEMGRGLPFYVSGLGCLVCFGLAAWVEQPAKGESAA